MLVCRLILTNDRMWLNSIPQDLAQRRAEDDAVGPPSTLDLQNWCIRTFNEVRESQGHDLGEPPPKFFFVVLVRQLAGIIVPQNEGDPVLFDDLTARYRIILKYCFNRYGYEISESESVKVKAEVNKLIEEGRLVRGKRRATPRLDTISTIHITRAIFLQAETDGTQSIDNVIYDALQLNMFRVMRARAGDIAVSTGYRNMKPHNGQLGHYVAYENIAIWLECGDSDIPTPQHLHMTIEMPFTKGMKNGGDCITHDATISNTGGTSDLMMLIIIHAARHDLIETDGSNSIEELLLYFKNQTNKKVVWTQPQWPVLCQKTGTKGHRLALDKPVATGGVLATLKKRGLEASVKGRITIDAVRAGESRQLNESQLVELNSNLDASKEALGHTTHSAESNVTREHQGQSKADYGNAIAESAILDPHSKNKVAKTAFKEFKKTREGKEIYQRAMEGVPHITEDKSAYRRGLREANKAVQEAYNKLVPNTLPSSVDPATNRLRQVLQDKDDNGQQTQPSLHGGQKKRTTKRHIEDEKEEEPGRSRGSKSQRRAIDGDEDGKEEGSEADKYKLIDDFEALESIGENADEEGEDEDAGLFVEEHEDSGADDSQLVDECDEILEVIAENLDNAKDDEDGEAKFQKLTKSNDIIAFTNQYLRKNVYTNDKLRRLAKDDPENAQLVLKEHYSISGGTRDEPSIFTIACPFDDCSFDAYDEEHRERHTRFCPHNPKNIYKCTECGRAFDTKAKLDKHMFTASGHVKKSNRGQTSQKLVQCPFSECGEQLTEAKWRNHVPDHKIKEYRCGFCALNNRDYVASKRATFNDHLRLHTKNDGISRAVLNDHCRDTLREVARVLSEYQRFPKDAKTFECEYTECKGYFKMGQEKPYNKHLEEVHGVDRE